MIHADQIVGGPSMKEDRFNFRVPPQRAGRPCHIFESDDLHSVMKPISIRRSDLQRRNLAHWKWAAFASEATMLAMARGVRALTKPRRAIRSSGRLGK